MSNFDNKWYLPKCLIEIKAKEISNRKKISSLILPYNYYNNLKEAQKYLENNKHHIIFWYLNQPLKKLRINLLELKLYMNKSFLGSLLKISIELLAIIVSAIVVIHQTNVNTNNIRNQILKQDLIEYKRQILNLILKEKLLLDESSSSTLKAARSLTSSTIQSLNSEQNQDLIWFISEMNLTQIKTEYTVPVILLSANNLNEANLEGARLEEAYLKKTQLINANLEGATLSGAILINANLNNANLKKAWLYRTNLKKANLMRANLKGAYLKKADLEGANLIRINLEGAYLDTIEKIKLSDIKILRSARNWEKAVYTKAVWNNKNNIWVPKDKKANELEIKKIRDAE